MNPVAPVIALALAATLSAPSQAAAAPGVRIAIVTDSHFSATPDAKHQLYADRFQRIVDEVNRAKPDVVLIPGDLTEDGDIAALKLFRHAAERLEARWFVVPGNHDVGPKRLPGSKDGTTAGRQEAFRSVMGPAFGVETTARLRVVRLDGSLFGSGLPEETQQWEMLERACAARSRKPAVVMMHYPLFGVTPDEPGGEYWNVEPGPRARILGLMAAAGMTLEIAGHVHRDHMVDGAGVRVICSRPTSFGLPAGKQPEGWTLVTLSDQGPATAERRTVN